MKKNYALIVITFLCGILFSHGQVSDLIISEYAEGSSNNKYVEIYNGTGASVDLSDYELWRVTNGGTWPEATLSLTGTLADGATYVVANGSADPTILANADITAGFVSHSGDDAVGLAKDIAGTFTLIDAVGTDGPDPGTGWNVAGTTNGTKEHTLVRKTTVCAPNTNWTTSAGTTVANSEWVVQAQNYWTDIDSHTSMCSTDTSVQFASATSSLSEAGTSITVCVSIINEDPNPTTVDISLDGSSTATNGTDYDDGAASAIIFPQTLTFPANSSSDVCVTFFMSDDALLEGDETIILNLSNPTGGNSAGLGGTTQHTLTILDDEIPPIADVVITEIMYNTIGTDDEWIEICNISGSPQDVSDYTIEVQGTLEFTFSSSTPPIADGACITVSLGDNNVAPYNPSCVFAPTYNNGIGTNNLANSSTRTITITADDGSTLVDSVTYDNTVGGNGNDGTLHVIDATADNSNTSSNWQEVLYGGSPGLNTLTPSCIPSFPDINVEGDVGSYPDIASDGSNVPVGFNNTLFPATAIGTGTPPTKSYRIQNTGTIVLNINSITLSGANPGDFAVSSIPSTVAAGSVETFTITFNPSATGDRTAIVTIDSDDPDGFEDPYDFNIKGSGVCASSTISATSFAPLNGPVGTVVTITGNGFSASSVVTINGQTANVISGTSTELIIQIPNITNSGPFIITEGSCFTISSNFSLISNNSNCGLTELIMSEIYDEDGGSLGYFEVYNGTGSTIDLSSYYIRRYGSAQNQIDNVYTDYYFSPSQSTIDDGQVLVGKVSTDPDLITPDFDFTNVSGFAGINGEDIFHLYNATTLLDVFTVPNNTVGYTATRDVNTPGPNPIDSSEWTHTNSETTAGLGTFGYVQVIDRPTVIGPSDFIDCGDFAEFEVQATPNDGSNSLTYQWYYNEGNSSDLDWEVVTGGAFPLVTVSGINGDTLTLTGAFESYDGYQFYCLVTEDGACGIASSAARLDIPTTTWTMSNSWDNGTPDINTIAIIDNSYDTATYGSFSACRLTIDSGTLNIRNGHYVEINYDLIINGTLDIETEGSLVMIDDTGTVTNNGTTNVHKTTTEMETYDYTYWSSPVDYSSSGTSIQTVLTGFRPSRIYSFNTSQFFDVQDSDGNAVADGFDDDLNAWTNHYWDMTSGIGYAAMTDGTGTGGHFRSVTFNGQLNTGTISVPVVLSQNAADTNDDWNLLGNPYPSAIYVDEFINHNSTILSGTVYLWSHEDDIDILNPGPDTYNFRSNDYAMYNGVGGVGTASTGDIVSNIPTGYIASGQGFFIDAITAGTVEFTNAMRNRTYSNDDFFRNSEPNSSLLTEKDRMWLNLTNPDGAFSQILVGYMDDGTLEKDPLYDGIRLEGSNYIDFYSKDETNTNKYGIQGRPPFSIDDVIPLGYDSSILGELTISLYQTEGVLSNINVYLKDNLLNSIHDLTSSNYTFTTENGSFSNRFEIVFQSEALSIDDHQISSDELSIIELQNGSVKFSVGNNTITIDTIEIIDLLGRTLYQLKGNSSSEIFELNNLSQTAYIAKISLSNGQTIIKRAVKRH